MMSPQINIINIVIVATTIITTTNITMQRAGKTPRTLNNEKKKLWQFHAKKTDIAVTYM